MNTVVNLTERTEFATPKVSTTAARLKALVEQIERINSEIADLNTDKSEIFAGVKAEGFNVKALKAVIKIRADRAKRGQDEISAEKADVDLYLESIGELPLFAGVGKGE